MEADTVSGAEKNIRRLLTCLEYPFVDSLDFDTEKYQQIHQLIVWLEDRKIRALDVSEREPLRDLSTHWDHVVSRYLSDLGCPHAWSRGTALPCLIWLVNYAVSLDYEDNG